MHDMEETEVQVEVQEKDFTPTIETKLKAPHH